MGTLRRGAGTGPRHRATVSARWIDALARHRAHAALAAAAAAALAAGVLLLPGPSVSPPARGCGLVACTFRRLAPAAATGESAAGLRGARQAPARGTVAPAQPGAGATASPPPSPSPSPPAPHHGLANGLPHRRHRH